MVNDCQDGKWNNSIADIGTIKNIDLPLFIETTLILPSRAHGQIWYTIGIEIHRAALIAKSGLSLRD